MEGEKREGDSRGAMFERVKTKKEEAGEHETLPATELIVFALDSRMGTFALEFNKSTNHHDDVVPTGIRCTISYFNFL
jgi:hypothetical protein